jgi:hypothetical protein
MAETPQGDPHPAPPQGPVAAPAPAEAPPKDQRPPWWQRWPQRVRTNVERHLFFWVMLGVSVYLVVGVGQITNVLWQWPPLKAGWWWVGTAVFLPPLLAFYLGSVLVVLDSPFHAAPAKPDEETGVVRRALWLMLGAAPDAVAGGLSWLTAGPQPVAPPPAKEGEAAPRRTLGERTRLWVEPARGRVARHLSGRRGGGVVLVLGLVALGSGPASDSSLVYPLVGSFCRGLGLILVGIGLWLLAGRDQQADQEYPGFFSRESLVLAALLVVGAGAFAGGVIWRDASYVLGVVCRLLGAAVAGVGIGLLVSGGGRWGEGRWGLGMLAAGLAALVVAATSDSLAASPWAGGLCRGLGLLLAGVGVGVLVWGGWFRRASRPGDGRRYAGRLLSWLFVTACAGEALWGLAGPDWLWGAFSYRLYTIWAILQALAFLILLGLLTDRLRELYEGWPVRLFAAGALVVGFAAFTHWETVSPDEVGRHLTPDYREAARAADKDAAADPARARAARAERWFKQF